MARLRAFEIPIWSSSLDETHPSPVVASLIMMELSSSRFLAVSFLESLSCGYQGRSSGGRMTAPMTSGPARGPRPTSSMPSIAIKLPEPLRWLRLGSLGSRLEFLGL